MEEAEKSITKPKYREFSQDIYLEGSFYGNFIAKFQLKLTDTTPKK